MALNDAAQPACCPRCLHVFSDRIARDMAASAQLLVACHPFFDACVAAVTLPRTHDDLAQLRRGLQHNIDTCSLHHAADDLVHLFINSCATGLYAGLRNAVARGHQENKAFSNTHGRLRWPAAKESLFPYGAEASIRALVTWCATLGPASDSALAVLAQYLSAARSHVWPILMESSDIRRRVVDVLVAHLTASDGPRTIRAKCIDAAHLFLAELLLGPGSHPRDATQFTSAYAAELFWPVRRALVERSKTDPAFDVLRTFTFILQHEAGLDEDCIPSFFRQRPRVERPRNGDFLYIGLFDLLRNIRAAHRTCANALCTRTASGAGAYLRPCSQCLAMRYCGRECQLEDWKRGWPVTHKAACPHVRVFLAAFSGDTVPEDINWTSLQAAGLGWRQMVTLVALGFAQRGPFSFPLELQSELQPMVCHST